MNRSATLIFRSARLPYRCRQFLPIRTYVNWTPDKSNNKKGKRPSSPSDRQSAPSGDALSPAELDKAFQPQSPPPNTEPIPPASEPQLLRLKNTKSSKEWEEEWSERVWRTGQATVLISLVVVGYAIWADYIHLPYGMNYRPLKLPEPGSEEEVQYLKRVERTLHSLPIVQKLSENPDFVKTVGIFSVPATDLPHNLTLGTLAGSGRITVKPVTFYNDKTKEFVVVMHVGQDVCGHRGLVHGGFLATILDECLGKTVDHTTLFLLTDRLLPHCPRNTMQRGRNGRYGLKIGLLSRPT